ncbi:hypothetical protein FQR65_LT05437 [Abscondita terminalis]|nr:hypothetical protein FQR65_LT05437 [Abscondita terminalis]
MDCADIHIENSRKFRLFIKWIPARVVLYLLSLNGIGVGYLMRLSINLTILAMVKERPIQTNFNETLCNVNNNGTLQTPIDYQGTLDWSFDDQYYVLNSFYWSYLLANSISGTFVQKYGTKKMFGWSLLISSICIVSIPFTSNIHYIVVVVVQSIHGFVQGFAWTALYAVIGVWIPANEKSRFVTSFQGALIGMMVAYLMSGFITSKFGWPYVFYCIGVLGFLSSVVWYLLMHDKPEDHPRISKQELHYIQQNREQCLNLDTVIPWKSIFTSVPVWVLCITSFGRAWLAFSLQIYGPLYLKTVGGVTLETNGLLLGISSFLSLVSVMFFSTIADLIATYKLMPVDYNRKLFSGIGQIIPGFLVLVLCFLECNIIMIFTVWVSIHIMLTANFAGAMTNITDIAPNFTGPVSSLIQMMILSTTIFSPLMLKTLLQNENIFQAWRDFFYICSGLIIGTYLMYAVFGSGKVQSWNFSKTMNDKNEIKDEEELLVDKIDIELRSITGSS